MEHVVFYPSAEGGSAFKRVSSLDEAVAFVEHLRNSENITDFSVHTLTPVPLSFRAYYHVEVPAEDLTAVPAPASEPVTEELPVAEPVTLVAEVAPEEPVALVTPEDSVAETAPEETVAEATPEAVEVPEQAHAPDASASEDVTMVPAEAVEEDRSAAWVAEAPVVEAPVEPAAAPVEPVAAGPFAEAPPVTPQGTDDVVPVPTGKRSMGFFAR